MNFAEDSSGKTPRPFLLADDLSGALEAGAAFHSRGWDVRVPLNSGAVPGSPQDGQMVVISTESRNATPEQAVGAVKAALGAVRAAGGRLLCKKIDSTLRGPVGAELEAVLEGLRPPLVVLCPANPGAGRVVRDGRLWVQGKPLDETAFRHDPLWPARTSVVTQLLDAAGKWERTEHLSLRELRSDPDQRIRVAMASTPPLLIADGETAADLEQLVASVQRVDARIVLVGSGALAAQVADRMGAPSLPPVTPKPTPALKRFLVLCGSQHPASLGQLALLSERGEATVDTLDIDGESVEAMALRIEGLFRAQPVVAVKFGFSQPPGPDASRRLMDRVATLVGRLDRDGGPDGYFLTGGETAWAACHALQGQELRLFGEVEPGVVMARLRRRGGAEIVVVTKPGGFGSPDLLSGLVRDLRAGVVAAHQAGACHD